jgi:predicted RNase H-like HicB family nuclease
MKYTYSITNDSDGVTATCAEISVSATGATYAEAVAALRDAICERLTHVEAVAPPDSVPVPSIELVPAREPSAEPQGPGDAAAAEHIAPQRQ